MAVAVNCGIEALQKITKLKSISMFTLLHLARDNGIEMYFCRVDKDKIGSLTRPAILHSDDHFTLLKDNEAIPDADYSGWVLTPKPMGTPLPFSLAKQISGGKKGGFARVILPTIIGFVSNLIIPGSGVITGALSNVGMDQYAKGNHPEQLGKPGKPLDIIGAGLAGAASGAASQGLIAGFKGASNIAGATLGSKVGGALQGAVTGLTHPIASNPLFGSNPGSLFPGSLSSQVAGFNGGASSALASTAGGASSLAGGAAASGTGYTGALAGSAASKNLAVSPAAAAGNQSGISSLSSGASGNTISAVPKSGAGTSGSFLGLNSKDLLKTGVGMLAGQIGKPPAYEPDSTAAYDKASQYLQGAKLPSVTNDQLNRYLAMPINDIKSELMNPSAANRSLLEIDKRYQENLANVQRIAANSGQSIQTSSDARKQYDEVNRQWAEARANLQSELDQQALNQAVGIKQWALEQSLQQGQVDMNAALELAAMMGRDEELKQTIARDDYQGFQSLIQELLSIGVGGGNQGKSGGININVGSGLA